MPEQPSLSCIDPMLWPEEWPYKLVCYHQLDSLDDGKDISNRRREFLYRYLFDNGKTKKTNQAFSPITKKAVNQYFGFIGTNSYFDKILQQKESWKEFVAKQMSGQPAIDSPALSHAPAAAQNLDIQHHNILAAPVDSNDDIVDLTRTDDKPPSVNTKELCLKDLSAPVLGQIHEKILINHQVIKYGKSGWVRNLPPHQWSEFYDAQENSFVTAEEREVRGIQFLPKIPEQFSELLEAMKKGRGFAIVSCIEVIMHAMKDMIKDPSLYNLIQYFTVGGEPSPVHASRLIDEVLSTITDDKFEKIFETLNEGDDHSSRWQMTLDKLKLDMFESNKEVACFRLLMSFARGFNDRMAMLYPEEYGIPINPRWSVTSILRSVIETRRARKGQQRILEPCCNQQAMHADGTTENIGHVALIVLSEEAGALATFKNSYQSIDNVGLFVDKHFSDFEGEWQGLDDKTKQDFGIPGDSEEELKANCWNLVYFEHGQKADDWEYLVPELLSWEAIILYRNQYHCGARYPNPIPRIMVNYEPFLHTEHESSPHYIVLQEPAAVQAVHCGGRKRQIPINPTKKQHFRLHFYNYGDWERDESTGLYQPADIQTITVDYRRILEMTPIFSNLKRFPREIQRYPHFITKAAEKAAPVRPPAVAGNAAGATGGGG